MRIRLTGLRAREHYRWGELRRQGVVLAPQIHSRGGEAEGIIFPHKNATYTRTIQDAAGNTQSRSVTVRSIVTAMRVEEYKNVFLKGDLDF